MHDLRLASEATITCPPIAADGESAARPTFRLVGYTGAAIRQAWSRNPLVVDLAGLQDAGPVAVMLGHEYDVDHAVGQASAVTNTGTELVVEGEVIGSSPEVQKVLELARAGWQFQASIGANVGRIENVAAGEQVTVNGREFSGPISVVRASSLREVSIVLFGADPNTSAAIAAEASQECVPMAQANDLPEDVVASEAPASGAVVPVTAGTDGASLIDADTVAAKVLEKIRGEILANMRAERPAGPAIHVAAPAATDERTVTASLCLAGGLQDVERHFDERTLEAASKRRHGSVAEVLVQAARANGYDGDGYRINTGNLRQVLKAAFATHAIANVLSATYNKFLLQGFSAVESVWDRISLIRSVSDFKLVTGIRVNGGFEFEEVGNGGTLKSADASDETRTFGAKTYGRISSITRTDLINDDLGALSVVPARLGRGAATKLNKVFWSEFESSNASYYAKKSPAAGNALSLDSLEAAATAYAKLTDPDGNPLAVAPSILLVPKELELAAAKLMQSGLLIGGSTVTTSQNVLAGRYQIVSSFYLSSATTWWLAANPTELNAMEVVFLNGQRTPTVEQAEADFDTLGIAVRGYHDWGVAKGESKAMYRMATA